MAMNGRTCATCALWGPETVRRFEPWWSGLPPFGECHLEGMSPDLVATHGPEPIYTAPGHGCNAWTAMDEPPQGMPA